MRKRNIISLIAKLLLAGCLLGSAVACVRNSPEELPSPQVPAVPNVSIVTAKVVEINRLSGNLPWDIVIEVQDSKDVPDYFNFIEQKIGETINVRTEEDAGQLEVDQIITAYVRLEEDERMGYYYAWYIE